MVRLIRDGEDFTLTLYRSDESKVFYTWQHAFSYSSPPEQLEICLPAAFETEDTKQQRLNVRLHNIECHCSYLF
jgi:hypothetical protein